MQNVKPKLISRETVPHDRALTLRARLILLVVAGVVPLLLFSLGQQFLEYRQVRTDAGQRALNLSRGMIRRVDGELQRYIAILQVLALSTALQTKDFAAFRARAEAVVGQQLPGSNIILLTGDGQQLMNTILPGGALLPVRPNLDSLKAMFASGAPVVSNLYAGAVGRRHVTAIDVPVMRADGSIAYALSVNPSLQTFSDVVRSERPQEGWVVSVFDGVGTTVARTPNQERFVGQAGSPSFLPHLLGSHEGIVEVTSLEGAAVLSAFSHSDKFAWSVGVGVPQATLIAPAFDAAMRTLAVGALILIVSLLMAVMMARQVTRPMAVLRRLAVSSDAAELPGVSATGLREADEVIAAFRTAEERRQRSEAHERRADAELARHVAALERSNQELDDFAYIASHDLKEPLRGLCNNAKFLREDYAGKLDPEGVSRLVRLGYLSQRMEQLVNDLLYVSRLGRQELAIQPIDLNAVIRDIETMSETMLKERNATIVIPHDLPRISCDKTRIAEVFRNLITNAVKYNDNAIKRVEVGYLDEVKTTNAVVRQVFYVKDNGIGIAEEFHEEIFRIFKRLNTEDDDKKGTGVGLTFVRKIVERHGGRIWLDAAPGGGTIFYFTIDQGPRYKAAA